jgi:hypothetical protein
MTVSHSPACRLPFSRLPLADAARRRYSDLGFRLDGEPRRSKPRRILLGSGRARAPRPTHRRSRAVRRVWLTLALLVPLLIALTGVAAYLTWSATQSPNPIEVLAPEVRFDGCGEDYYASFQPVLGQDNNHPEEQDTKPVKGAVFFDEFYNTCMVRVTDHANEPPVDFARNDYSRRQAFNADSSRFVTISHDGSWHLYDGATLEYLNVLRGPAGDSEIQWHPTDPNLLFYLPNAGGMVIYQYDIRDDSSTIVGDFGRDDRDVPLPWPTAARVWTKSEGSPSADGRYWGFQVETSNFEPLGLMVWDMQTDEILGTWDFAEHGVGRPDHVSMSPSGEYIVPSWDGNAYGTTAFSRDFTQQVKLHHKSEHSDLALLPNGHDAYVSVDYQSNAGDVFMVEIQTGQKTVLFPTYLNGTATALHVSGKAFNRPGWILMSTYSTQPATHWLHKKLFAVELKADPTIVNLAHTHVVSNGYWSEPHASVNRDFTRVIFNSNWDTGSDLDVDAYIVVLPNRVF